MSKYEFKAINLIAETFEKHGIKLKVEEAPGAEIIIAGFPIDGGLRLPSGSLVVIMTTTLLQGFFVLLQKYLKLDDPASRMPAIS